MKILLFFLPKVNGYGNYYIINNVDQSINALLYLLV